MSLKKCKSEFFSGDAKIIREMIRHENELVNHRVGWFMAGQGFLFNALATVYEKNSVADLICIISFAGLFSSILALINLIMSSSAIHELNDYWEKYKEVCENNRDCCNENTDCKCKEEPRVIGAFSNESKCLVLLMPYVLLPAVFIFAWIKVFLIF